MSIKAASLAAVLACALVPATAGLILAQAGAAPPPAPAPAPGQGYYDPDFDRQQQPGQAPAPQAPGADPDALLSDLFTDPGQQGQPYPPQGGQPYPAQGQPYPPQSQQQPYPGAAPGSGVLSLPGVPSPVSTPAGPGEAVVERQGQQQASMPRTPGAPGVAPGTGQAAGAAAQPATAAPVRRRYRARKAYDWPTSPWVKQVYEGAEKAWRVPHLPKGCQTLVDGRLVYNIRCMSRPRLIGKPMPPYKDKPSVYYVWP
ncbi:MAG: hypothetical protein LBT40_00980 [Deltaproteobacteria bacterium]|jgi:hypothetical protein|nr:hypothetical protein [Deltaproteobacteria bacterium]